MSMWTTLITGDLHFLRAGPGPTDVERLVALEPEALGRVAGRPCSGTAAPRPIVEVRAVERPALASTARTPSSAVPFAARVRASCP